MKPRILVLVCRTGLALEQEKPPVFVRGKGSQDVTTSGPGTRHRGSRSTVGFHHESMKSQETCGRSAPVRSRCQNCHNRHNFDSYVVLSALKSNDLARRHLACALHYGTSVYRLRQREDGPIEPRTGSRSDRGSSVIEFPEKGYRKDQGDLSIVSPYVVLLTSLAAGVSRVAG
jgi:hypothetical protein